LVCAYRMCMYVCVWVCARICCDLVSHARLDVSRFVREDPLLLSTHYLHIDYVSIGTKNRDIFPNLDLSGSKSGLRLLHGYNGVFE